MVGGGGAGRASADDRDVHLSWHGRDLHPSVGIDLWALLGPTDSGPEELVKSFTRTCDKPITK